MKNVFISYRRDDSLATAGRTRDRVAAKLGSACVFVDIKDIAADLDFLRVLERRLADCGVPLVIIGQQVIFEITSPVSGRLILLDLNAAGQLTQIFPNSYAPSEEISQIEAQRQVSVPGPDYGFSGFKAVEPLGRGRLIAIVQPREAGAPLDIVRAEIARRFDPIRSPANYLQAIADQIERADGPKSSWGFALSDYEIVR